MMNYSKENTKQHFIIKYIQTAKKFKENYGVSFKNEKSYFVIVKK